MKHSGRAAGAVSMAAGESIGKPALRGRMSVIVGMRVLSPLVGLVSGFLYVATMALALIIILPLSLLRLLIPPWQHRINRGLGWIAYSWIAFNNAQQWLLARTRVQVEGDVSALSRHEWYLLIANHQSWVDILVLFRAFNPHIPFVKFFYKKELLWVPLLGQALWGLDFPMMHRHTKEQIRRNPALRRQDMEQTQKACLAYRYSPVTIITFPEGTRFTPAKHQAQGSEYPHLLRPRAGGMAFSLAAMGGRLGHLLDVTIYYPEGRPNFWQFLCGKVSRVRVHFRQIKLGPAQMGDYQGDEAFRNNFQAWVNQLWREKNQRLADMAAEESSGA